MSAINSSRGHSEAVSNESQRLQYAQKVVRGYLTDTDSPLSIPFSMSAIASGDLSRAANIDPLATLHNAQALARTLADIHITHSGLEPIRSLPKDKFDLLDLLANLLDILEIEMQAQENADWFVHSENELSKGITPPPSIHSSDCTDLKQTK